MNTKANTQPNNDKRKLIVLSAAALTSPIWAKPMINSVMLPAHAQTSNLCITDTTIGGPLAGNPSGATTCQAACEAEAAARNAQLCEVRETPTATGTDCSCDLDLP